MRSRTLFFLSILCLAGIGCEQELVPLNAAQKDELPPEVMVYSPFNGEVFEGNEGVKVDLDVIENFKLHDVLIQVFDQNKNSLLWDFYVHTHQVNIEIREQIPAGLLKTGDYRMSIESQDHDYNLILVERIFSVR